MLYIQAGLQASFLKPLILCVTSYVSVVGQFKRFLIAILFTLKETLLEID